ncbi:MAG: TonB-dependent receptor domain-containing protein [bacterium]
MTFRTPLLSLIALALFAMPAQAGTTGKLAGRVRDNSTSQPIPSATITIRDTRYASISDENGQFFILNVPTGDYTIDVHALGYRDASTAATHVTADFTTSVTIEMQSVVTVVTPVVSVEGTRPLIQRDATTTVRVIDAEEIANSPSRGYLDIVARQTGVVSFANHNAFQIGATERTNTPVLVMRGGRPEEVGYYVDGFSQQDLQSGFTTATVPNAALSEIVVMPGGFAAEYGRNLSGVVNIATKEGGDRLSGSFEALSDGPSGDWIGTPSYDQNIYAATLGGPLVPGSNTWRFFGAVERGWSRDGTPSPLSDGQLPGNSVGSWLWNAKISGKLSNSVDVKLGSTGSQQAWREYRNVYRFDLDHAPRYLDKNASGYVQLTHTLDARTFQNLAVGLFSTQRTRGDATLFENLGAYGSNGAAGNPSYDPIEGLFVYGADDSAGAHIYDNFFRRQSSYTAVKWDLTRQVGYHHLGKVGIDFQRHTLRSYQHLIPSSIYESNTNPYSDVESYGYDSTGVGTELDDGINGAKHPVAIGAFLQDKIEYAGLIFQPGVRYDYFDSQTLRVKDEANPLDDASQLTPDRLEESRPSHSLSPRLGIAFPISDVTSVHLNYGKFYQQPNLTELYTNYSYMAYKIRTGGYYFPFGNPNLEPGETIAYEVGLSRQLSKSAKMELSTYYKDIRGLSQVSRVSSNPNQFASYRNIDYGTAKGIDLHLALERTKRLSGALNYSIGFAEGTGSISNTNRIIAWTGAVTPKQTAPLAFDQRHRLSVVSDYRLSHGEGPTFLGRKPLSKAGLAAVFVAASGLPYTPTEVYNEVTLQSVNGTPSGPINSARAPWTYQLDLKVDRDFDVGYTNLNAFVWVVNVLDRKNPSTVYSSSGLPDETGWLSTPEGQAWLESNGEGARERYELAQNDPRNYLTPRLVRFGLRTSF